MMNPAQTVITTCGGSGRLRRMTGRDEIGGSTLDAQ